MATDYIKSIAFIFRAQGRTRAVWVSVQVVCSWQSETAVPWDLLNDFGFEAAIDVAKSVAASRCSSWLMMMWRWSVRLDWCRLTRTAKWPFDHAFAAEGFLFAPCRTCKERIEDIFEVVQQPHNFFRNVIYT